MQLLRHPAFLGIVSVSLLLAACGGDHAGPSSTGGADTNAANANSAYARALIKEDGCDPRIANALSPYESEYGECSMKRYTDICGEENEAAGIALIAQVRGAELEGVNPWLWACARNAGARNALIASCTSRGRLGGSIDDCTCAVDVTLAQEDDSEMVRWLSYTEADDAVGSDAEFAKFYDLESGKIEALQELRARHYRRFQTCRGS